MKDRVFTSDEPFTVHVVYTDGLAPDADFKAVQVDEHEYVWPQMQWNGAIITALDANGNPVNEEK